VQNRDARRHRREAIPGAGKVNVHAAALHVVKSPQGVGDGIELQVDHAPGAIRWTHVRGAELFMLRWISSFAAK
jgi:hypothetical protein